MSETVAKYVRQLLEKDESGTFALGYLKAEVLGKAVDDLFYARQRAELTQEQVAERLNRKQEAISRWEKDKEGRLSLRQYVNLAMACGMVPRIKLVPFEEARGDLMRELAREASE